VSNSEVLETRGNYRVRLVPDEDAEEPYNCGQSPLIRISHRSGYPHAEHVMADERPTGHDKRIEYAFTRWYSGDEATLRKYLRAFHGMTRWEEYRSQDYTYVTYDTAEWRAYTGFSADSPMPDNAVNLDEYRAWCEGDVYGWIVEKQVNWTDDDADNHTQTWEEEASRWGYYGYEYAEESAREALDGFAPKEVSKETGESR
jgi:hypothetical protein